MSNSDNTITSCGRLIIILYKIYLHSDFETVNFSINIKRQAEFKIQNTRI